MDSTAAKETITNHSLGHLHSALIALINAEKAARALRCLGVPAKGQRVAITKVITAILTLDPTQEQELNDLTDTWAVKH